MTNAQTYAQKMGKTLRDLRVRAGLTQREVAIYAQTKKARVGHVEQGGEVAPAKALRWMAHAADAKGNETIDLLTMATLARARPAVAVEGLDEKQVRQVVRLVEKLRRRAGKPGACAKCNAGPTAMCADGCPEKQGVNHG